jgi:hypothetical protein
VVHRNAPLTPEGHRRLCERVDAGRPVCHVAAEAGVARQPWRNGTPGGRNRARTACRIGRPGRTGRRTRPTRRWRT